MYLFRCPQCNGHTPIEEDAEWGHCQWCRRSVSTADGRNVVRDPAGIRDYVFADLRPVSTLLLTFGIGQTIIALVYFWVFISLMSNGGSYLIGTFEHNPMIYAIGVVLLIGGAVIIAGSRAIRQGRRRLIAVAGAILTLASPLFVGLPVGIWALWKLNRPEAREAFTIR